MFVNNHIIHGQQNIFRRLKSLPDNHIKIFDFKRNACDTLISSVLVFLRLYNKHIFKTQETCTYCKETLSQHVFESNDIRTSSNVLFNILRSFEVFATKTTAKLSDVRVDRLMLSQLGCCTETLLTFIANIPLHTFMSPNVYLQVRFAAEFLRTNVTREPSSFIVLLQQM